MNKLLKLYKKKYFIINNYLFFKLYFLMIKLCNYIYTTLTLIYFNFFIFKNELHLN